LRKKQSFLIKFFPDLKEAGKTRNHPYHKTKDGQPRLRSQPSVKINPGNNTQANSKPDLGTDTAVGYYLTQGSFFG